MTEEEVMKNAHKEGPDGREPKVRVVTWAEAKAPSWS